MSHRAVTCAGVVVLAACPLLADFSYQQKTTVTGGALAGMLKVAGVFSKQAREPMEATIAVQGDRMCHRSAYHANIIDLNAETITEIDLQKKTYSVMTFQQMKEMMARMSEKMHEQNPNGAQLTFKVSANNTGNSKQIGGVDAKEVVLKMEAQSTDQQSGQQGSLVITTDMWMAAPASGYDEVRQFYRRMAEKLNWSPGGNMFMSRPDIAEGMAQVNKEIGKMNAMPVFEVVSMGAAGQPGAAGAQGGTAQSQPAAQPQDQQQQQQPKSLGGALGGALGGHFGLGRKKSSSSDQSSGAQSSSGNSGPGSLIDMTVEMSGFSAAPVDSSLFSVPAGFKQVQPDSRRMH